VTATNNFHRVLQLAVSVDRHTAGRVCVSLAQNIDDIISTLSVRKACRSKFGATLTNRNQFSKFFHCWTQR